MSEIRMTKDYFMFKKHEANREIDNANLQKIKRSLQVKNLMQFKPILVDRDFRILDGQHRLEAAKQLGIDIYYQINEDADSEEIILINANQKKWLMEDYLNYFISKGNINYIKTKVYCEKHGLKLHDFLRLNSSAYIIGGRKTNFFIIGKFVFPNEEKINHLEHIITGLNKVIHALSSFLVSERKFLSSSLFRRAVLSFVGREDVDIDVFINKLGYKIESVHPCAEVIGYVNMFKEIYNWRNKNPLLD